MKKILLAGGLSFSAIFSGCDDQPVKVEGDTPKQEHVVEVVQKVQTQAEIQNVPNENSLAKANDTIVEESPKNSLTGPQRNAVRSALQYLNVSGFSRDGLIDQLSSDYGDGYDFTDATIAVDSLNIDWNVQAVRSAQNYLSISGFSCSGLTEQLSSSYGDKYTRSQASYGAQQAGAC